MSNVVALKRFYNLMARLEKLPNQGHPLCQLPSSQALPKRGLYFFQECGEIFEPTGALRIVRVGTHAVSKGSRATLHSRLKNHMGSQSGSGNHRSSIFRRHVGDALLAKENHQIITWGSGSQKPQELRTNPVAQSAEEQCEKRVSEIIGKMPVLWVDISDEPGSTSERAIVERNSIALLSDRRSSFTSASNQWLGRLSPRAEIRESSLWNLKHIDETFDPDFLDILEKAVDRTAR